MNFMISVLGWFLWNWAEYSITKQKGEGYEYLEPITDHVKESSLHDDEKATLISKISALFSKPVTLREYAATHYETWVGSFATIFLLLWIGYRNLDIDPIAPIFGIEAKLGWNDVYLVGCGAAWDAFIFGFKWIKNFFAKKKI